jgi:hypothetical protein
LKNSDSYFISEEIEMKDKELEQGHMVVNQILRLFDPKTMYSI